MQSAFPEILALKKIILKNLFCSQIYKFLNKISFQKPHHLYIYVILIEIFLLMFSQNNLMAFTITFLIRLLCTLYSHISIHKVRGYVHKVSPTIYYVCGFSFLLYDEKNVRAFIN